MSEIDRPGKDLISQAFLREYQKALLLSLQKAGYLEDELLCKCLTEPELTDLYG